MSWSVSATGADSESTVVDLVQKLANDKYCPPYMVSAIGAAAGAMTKGMRTPVLHAASSGHINDDGKGYANVSINSN